MSDMVEWTTLDTLEPGEIFETESGQGGLVTEYTDNLGQCLIYLLGSGETGIFQGRPHEVIRVRRCEAIPLADKSQGQTPLQAAALAALVAWRKADIVWLAEPRWVEEQANTMDATEAALRDAADRLMAVAE